MTPTGFTQVSASGLQDSTGALLSNATISFTPTNHLGVPISFRSGGSNSGQVCTDAVSLAVVNGAFSIALADTSLTMPLNVGYAVSLTSDLTGDELLGPGYTCIQPSGASWSFDQYATSTVPNALVLSGPAGKDGIRGAAGVDGTAGQTGPAGTTTLTGSNGMFNAQGGLQVAPASPILYASNVQMNYQQYAAIQFDASVCGHSWNGINNNWRLTSGFKLLLDNTTRGIKQLYSGNFNNDGEGDTALKYVYLDTVPSGLKDGSCEGTTASTWEVREYRSNFMGAVATTTGRGDTQPTYTLTLQSGGDAGQSVIADGGILINASLGTVAGTMGGFGSPYENWLARMPITVTAGAVNNALPICSAWGGFADTLNATNEPTSQYRQDTVTVNLSIQGKTSNPFTVGVCRLMGSGRPEMVVVSAVGTPSNGQQSVTFQHRYPQFGGYLFQGGLAGQVMSFDANYAFSGRRTSHPVASIDGTSVLYSVYLNGAAQANVLPMSGLEAANPRIPSLAGVHFFPGAEVTAVLTPRGSNPPACLLETNDMAWAAGHLVEALFPCWWGGNMNWQTIYHSTPAHQSFNSTGYNLNMSGPGIGGSFTPFLINGANPDSMYRIGGGPLRKPLGYTIGSAYDNMPTVNALSVQHAPDPISVDHSSCLIGVGGSGAYQGTHFLGNTTAGSNTVTVMHPDGYQSTLGLETGDPISGPGIPANAQVMTVPDYDHVTIGVSTPVGDRRPQARGRAPARA